MKTTKMKTTVRFANNKINLKEELFFSTKNESSAGLGDGRREMREGMRPG